MKKVELVCLIFLSTLILGACQNHDKISISQDFEQMPGWNSHPNLVKGKGNSGFYFTRTGPDQDYSQTFSMKLVDISDKPIRRIDMGAWVRISSSLAKAKLVLSIESADSIMYWQSIRSEDVNPKPGEWTRLYFTYDLPVTIKPEHIVKMYLWNESKKEVDADDFDIHFYTK